MSKKPCFNCGRELYLLYDPNVTCQVVNPSFKMFYLCAECFEKEKERVTKVIATDGEGNPVWVEFDRILTNMRVAVKINGKECFVGSEVSFDPNKDHPGDVLKELAIQLQQVAEHEEFRKFFVEQCEENVK